MRARRFEDTLVDAVRQLESEPDPPHTLQRLVELAPEFFPTGDMAGVSVVESGVITTPVATTELLREVDELQHHLQEGPCFDAIRNEETIAVGNLALDSRWPRWGPRMAGELGIHSSLSFRLFTTSSGSWGALNIYARRPHAFTHEDIDRGLVLAAMAAVALARSLNQEQLATALETRTLIGQATGMLMERYQLDAEASFNVMRRISNHNNLKLRAVAEEIVRTRAVPGVGAEEPRT